MVWRGEYAVVCLAFVWLIEKAAYENPVSKKYEIKEIIFRNEIFYDSKNLLKIM